jgi:2-dehydro-3-deoxyphosphooctonate aldolase (KDO 8-P synthase)
MAVEQREVRAGSVAFGNDLPLAVIAGPCQLEGREHGMMMAEALKALSAELSMPLVFKASYDKANRTSLKAQRGMGLEESMAVFREIRDTFQLPVLTDVHLPEHCALVADSVDILQIPAFLCRQTDLLIAAAQTGKVVNVKKGQFLAPWDMKNVAAKIAGSGNDNILLCERGTSFGYNTLVSDFRGIPTMRAMGYPVVFDATHSVQQPGGLGGASGGQREFVPVLARAAVAIGVAGVFIETHEDPDRAPSDGPNMVPLDEMRALLTYLRDLDRFTKERAAA